MKLTVAQKDMLVRKAVLEIRRAMDRRRKEIEKTFKPDEQTKDYLKKLKKAYDARNKFLAEIESLGFSVEYSRISCTSSGDCPVYNTSIYISDKEDQFPKEEKRILDFALGRLLPYFPSENEIRDDIELTALTKDFNIESFLEKYRNL